MLKYAMIAALGLTAACVEQQVDNRPGRNYDLAFANCKRITGATGQYVVGPKATNGVPVVVAGQGGDLRGEVLMNECISQNLGTTVAKVPVAAQKAAPGKLPCRRKRSPMRRWSTMSSPSWMRCRSTNASSPAFRAGS